MRALEHPILTPRLRIEPVTPRLAAAARAGGDAFAQALGADAPPEWRQASLQLMARAAHGPSSAAPAPIRAVAIHRADGCVIGDARFEPVTLEPNIIEVGYSVTESRRRQGYAVEAVGAVLDWAFSEGRVKSAVAGCDRKNRASVATLRKLGFWLDGSAGTAFWWVINPDLRAAARA